MHVMRNPRVYMHKLTTILKSRKQIQQETCLRAHILRVKYLLVYARWYITYVGR